MMTFPYHLYLMALLYILAGLNHFRTPHFYIKMIPLFFPNPKLINIISGFSEIIFGVLLCIPITSQIAAFGIIALLVAIFPANIFMYQTIRKNIGVPRWILILRIPLQVALIIWAYQYTSFIK